MTRSTVKLRKKGASQGNQSYISKSEWRRINKNPRRHKQWLLLTEAYGLAEENDFEGLPRIQKRKHALQPLRYKGSPDGDLFKASEREIEPLRQALKAAREDIQQGRYTGRVMYAIKCFEALKAKDYLYEDTSVKKRIKRIKDDDL